MGSGERSPAWHGATWRWCPQRLAALVAVALALAGCAIAPDSSPVSLPRKDVPFGLLRPTPLASDSSQPQRSVVEVWLVEHRRLVPLHTHGPLPGRPDQAIRVLLGGLPESAAGLGLRSAIPDNTHLLSFDLLGSIAQLDLSAQFAQVRARDQILAVAQLVYTATVGGEANGVTFSVSGKPIEVPGPDGSLTPGPVTRTTYQSLLQPS